MADIFISYAQEDRHQVRPLVKALTTEGYQVWWDKADIRAGESFDECIETTLEKAGCVVTLWSRHAVISRWVRAESAWAYDHEKFISVCIDEGVKLPLKFYNVHTRSLVGWKGSQDAPAFQALLTDIAKITDLPSSSPDPSPSPELKPVPRCWPNNKVAANGPADVLKARGHLDTAGQHLLKARGHLDAAERQYHANMERWPNDEAAASGLAEVFKARNDLDAAERQYRANIERWPNDAVAASGLAEVLKTRGDLDAAERQYRANIERWPNNAVAASGLAEVRKVRGELEAAEQQYRESMRRWPNNEVAANGLADVLKARDDLDGAERQYRANIDRWPNNEVAASGLADVLKARGELEAAEQQYRENMERWPNNEVAANGLAEVLKAHGDLDGAERQYRANIERWPNDEVARHGLANVLRKQQHHAEALQLLPNPLQPVTARDLYDLHLRGMVLLELGRWDEALDAFERGLEAASAPVYQAAFRRGLMLMDLSRRNPEAAQQRLRELPQDIPQLNVYRLHAAAGRRDETEVRTLRTRLNADVIRMDFATRAAFREIETAYCLQGTAGICEPDEDTYRAVIDAEIEMERAA